MKKMLAISFVIIFIAYLAFSSGIGPNRISPPSGPPATWSHLDPVGLQTPDFPVEHLSISSNGRYLAWGAGTEGSMGGHGYAGVISLSDGQTVFSSRYPFDIHSIALNDAGDRLFIAGNGVWCVDVHKGAKLWQYEATRYDGVVCLPGGDVLANEQNLLVRLDPSTGAVKASRPFLQGFFEPHQIEHPIISANGSPMVIEDHPASSTALVLDPITLETTATFELPKGSLLSQPAISPDATHVFVHHSLPDRSFIVGHDPAHPLVEFKQRISMNCAPEFSIDDRFVFVPGQLLAESSVEYQLLKFDRVTGDLLQKSESLPIGFYIWSSAFNVNHGIVVLGGRDDSNHTAAIYWRSLSGLAPAQ